jgi:hypothetical protein
MTPRLLLLGEGPAFDRWACVLSKQAVFVSEPEDGLDAVFVGPGAVDPFARAREALQGGLAVLWAAPFPLSPWQAAALRDLALRERLLLRFAEPFRHRPGFAFLRRLLSGSEPFWRPLYLRTLRLGHTGGHIDELATDELASTLGLLDRPVRSVNASAARRDETGDVCAAFLGLEFEGGPHLQCTVSLGEALEGRQLVAAMPGRTVVLDELGAVASLRILGGEEGADRVLPAPASDPLAEEAAGFLRALADGDLAYGNGARWTRVAAVWWAARQSMSFGATTEVPVPPVRAGQTEPPPLRVIEGGGHTTRAGGRPPLVVLSR